MTNLVDGSPYLQGATDDTLIGNTGDRLKVEATGTVTATDPGQGIETYVANAEGVSLANNKSYISLLNNTGSTVVVRILELKVKNVQYTAVTGTVIDFKMFRFTSHTGGTSLTPLPYDTSDSLNSSVTCRTGATISGEAASFLKKFSWSADEWSSGTLDTESASNPFQIMFPVFYQPKNGKTITLRAGEGVHLKQVTSSTAGLFDVELIFTEASA